MNLTPEQLTAKEDAILDALEHTPGDRTFRGKLYRDGVPTPASYLSQPVRVLFVFREPNLGGVPRAFDMRDEVRDKWFRPLRDGARQVASARAQAGTLRTVTTAAHQTTICRATPRVRCARTLLGMRSIM